MPATIRTLVEHPAFGLELVVGTARDLDRPVAWVHSSDLPDPTPWLEPGQFLLTDGAQLSGPGSVDAALYVQRLADSGVVGLGFATEVLHASIPDDVAAACESRSMPLVRVPATTPFIGLIRLVADVVADERNARQAWLLDAQRAVARAAIRKDGLREILRTLSKRLDTWVALYDPTGHPVRIPGVAGIPAGWATAIDAAARRLLDHGIPGARRTADPHASALQTIGPSRRLRGVLAVGAAGAPGGPEADLIDSVVALASVALEQQRSVDDARGRVRTAILELLEAGAVRSADRAARAIWGPLPRPPLRVVAVRGTLPAPAALDELEIVATSGGGELFFAARAQDLAIVAGADAVDDLAPILTRHRLRAGVSSPLAEWGDLARGLAEALHAAGGRGPGLVGFEDRAAGGILATLLRGGGDLAAVHVLAPLGHLPPDEAARLRAAARAWFAANAAWDPAARALGIHRHTLRARLMRVGELTGLDLESFSGRAELWAALSLEAGDRDSSGEGDRDGG